MKQYRKSDLQNTNSQESRDFFQVCTVSAHVGYGWLAPESYTAGEEGYIIRSLNMLFLQIDYQLKSFIELKAPSLLLCIDLLCKVLLQTFQRLFETCTHILFLFILHSLFSFDVNIEKLKQYFFFFQISLSLILIILQHYI